LLKIGKIFPQILARSVIADYRIFGQISAKKLGNMAKFGLTHQARKILA